MNYKKIYFDLVSSRKELVRSKKAEYFEKHHIIPRSWGGSDDDSNLVLLSAREHWVAHLLLSKFATGQNKYKSHQAVVNMGRVIPESKRKTSKLYEKSRKNIAKEVSKRHTGTLIVNDSVTGKRIGRVPKSHPKVLSGEWIFFHKGIKRSEQYINNKKLESGGENNPRYCGISDDDIVNYGLELFEMIGEISSLNDLTIYVKQKYNVDLPKSYSKFRFPNKSYYEILEDKTNTKYNAFKRGKKLKSYQEKFKEILNDTN